MRISELAERSGVPATTLRFYETIGLVSADRTSAGYRDYDASAVDRLHVITEAKRLGLTLDDIGGLLATWTSGSCATTKADLRPRLTARLLAAQLETATLIARGGAVQVMLAHLDTLPDSDEACGPDCVLPSRPEPVIACSLTGSQGVERAEQWRSMLADATRTPLPDGVRMTLPVDRAADIATLAAAEQACCSFFDLRIHLDGPVLHLEVRAPEVAAEMITELFGSP
jgi:DNA-binding transcriptional MerR regulator